MITLRKSDERGHANHGWLDSYHSFSFADYYDPAHMGFRALRVINEDRIAGGEGFGIHPHKDMEILTYVIKGQLKHRDSMGNEGIIKAGEVQKMSAGSGVTHSEFNASPTEEAHLLQIWILPDKKGITPSYQQKEVSKDKGLVALPIHFNQNVTVYRGRLNAEEKAAVTLKVGHGAWVQVISGQIKVNNSLLKVGDAAAIEAEPHLDIHSLSASEFLLFDLG